MRSCMSEGIRVWGVGLVQDVGCGLWGVGCRVQGVRVCSYHLRPKDMQRFHGAIDLIRTSIYDTYSGSTKVTTRLDHTGHCNMKLIE